MHAAPAVEPQLALDVRAPRARRKTMRPGKLRPALGERAQRGDAAAVVGAERRCLARERGPAYDVAPRRARARAQLDQRGDGIGGQRFEQQLARGEQHPRRDDVDGPRARVGAGFAGRRAIGTSSNGSGPHGAGASIQPNDAHPPACVAPPTTPAFAAERRAQPAERAGQRPRAGREQQHVRRRRGARRGGDRAGTVDGGERRGARARVAGIAAG